MHIVSLIAALALANAEAYLLPLTQGATVAIVDGAEVDKNFLTIIRQDEAIALVGVEPLHLALKLAGF